jgi:hypothetical protein
LILSDEVESEKFPTLASHFISIVLKVDRVSPLQSSKREFRLATRYHHNVIAIEAFKRSYAQIHAGRFDPNEHRGAAICARMTFNFVGREAKQRFRRGHISLLRSIRTVKSIAVGSKWPGPFDPRQTVTAGSTAKSGSDGPPFLLHSERGSRPLVDQRTRLAAPLELANAFAVDAGLVTQ